MPIAPQSWPRRAFRGLVGGLGALLLLGASTDRTEIAPQEITVRKVVEFAKGSPVDLVWAGERGSADDPFPKASLYVLDASSGTVTRYNADGEELGRFGGSGSGPGQLRRPQGLSADWQRIYVADTGNDRVVVFDLEGQHIRTIGRSGSGPGEFREPRDVAVRRAVGDGAFFVSDTGNDRIQEFDLDGNFQEEIPLPSPTALTHTRFKGLVVASTALPALQELNRWPSRFEPLELGALPLGKLLSSPGAVAERDDRLLFTDREPPQLLVLDTRRGQLGRIRDLKVPPRAVAAGRRHEYPSVYVADGRRVVELGFVIEPPLAVFEAYRQALARQDIDGALEYIHPHQRQLFREILEEVEADLPATAADMKNVQVDRVAENEAVLQILMPLTYKGKQMTEA
jgi:hypothetical protein